MTEIRHEDVLRAVLSEARSRKYLGPASVDAHLANGASFSRVLRSTEATRVVDLGSGGGVPALVCAHQLGMTTWLLVERSTRRAQWLERAIIELDLAERVAVAAEGAAHVGRDPAYEGWADAATARSFGPPAVTAECACRFLRKGGILVVSEPPHHLSADATRWDADGLRPTGLTPLRQVIDDGTTLQLLVRRGEIDDRIPRRDAVIRKRPLF